VWEDNSAGSLDLLSRSTLPLHAQDERQVYTKLTEAA
jgi:hypothetical protein